MVEQPKVIITRQLVRNQHDVARNSFKVQQMDLFEFGFFLLGNTLGIIRMLGKTTERKNVSIRYKGFGSIEVSRSASFLVTSSHHYREDGNFVSLTFLVFANLLFSFLTNLPIISSLRHLVDGHKMLF